MRARINGMFRKVERGSGERQALVGHGCQPCSLGLGGRHCGAVPHRPQLLTILNVAVFKACVVTGVSCAVTHTVTRAKYDGAIVFQRKPGSGVVRPRNFRRSKWGSGGGETGRTDP